MGSPLTIKREKLMKILPYVHKIFVLALAQFFRFLHINGRLKSGLGRRDTGALCKKKCNT